MFEKHLMDLKRQIPSTNRNIIMALKDLMHIKLKIRIGLVGEHLITFIRFRFGPNLLIKGDRTRVLGC